MQRGEPAHSAYPFRARSGWIVAGLVLVSGCAAPLQQVPARLPPLPMQTAPLPGGMTHTVQPGETLWSIGRRYGVSHQDLMRANGLMDPSQLPAGRVLRIPQRSVIRASVPLYDNTRWTHIVIHHSATSLGNAKFFDRSHRRRGFRNGLGYHFVIDNGTMRRGDGQIEVGQRWLRQQEGAHCNAAGMNHHGIGICLVGDFTNHPPSDAQMAVLESLVDQLRTYYRIPLSRVLRHRDVPGKSTECPGSQFPWAVFRRQLARREHTRLAASE